MRSRIMHYFVTACLLLGFTVFMGCISSSDDDDLLSLLMQDTTQLSSYVEAVQDCTPYLGTSANGDLNEWDGGWNPQGDYQYTVLYKLFGPEDEAGAEGVFFPISLLDTFVEMINNLSDYWDEDGEYTRIVGENTITVNVDNSVDSVTVPFYGDVVSVDRLISVTSDMDGGMTLYCAFTIGETEEALVAHVAFDESGEIGTYYAQRDDTTGDIEIWSACYAPDLPDELDPFYCNFIWKGNPDDNWFSITQYTSAGNGWYVMGGGSVDSDMAFVSKNGDYNAFAEWYLTLDMDNINEGTDPGTLAAAAITAPDPVATAVHAYITDGEDECLGYLTEFSESAEDIAWEN